jgi:ATP-dependent DNA ligase
MKILYEIISKGGEGIILKLPKSSYESGITSSILKVIGTSEGKARIKSINSNYATCEL